MSEKKFAIINTIHNDEDVIGLFDTREQAVAFGDAVHKQYLEGILTCEQVTVDDNNKIVGGFRRLYESW